MFVVAAVAALGQVVPAPQASPTSAAAAPVVIGLGDPALGARDRGLVLVDELGCLACHQDDPPASWDPAPRGPDLAEVGSRVRPDYLLRFLGDPRGVEPGTAMPDLLRDRTPAARAEAATALAHYLRSFAEPDASAVAQDAAAAARGRALFHEIGCVACHAPRGADGDELPLAGSVPLGDLSAKYHPQGLRAFLLAPALVRPSARMPDFHLLPQEAHDLTCYLLARARSPAVAGDVEVRGFDADQVATGRALFATLGCANCHGLQDPRRPPARAAPPLRQLDPARGCMSGATGAWPAYDLTDAQRQDLTAALRPDTTPLTDEQCVRQLLAARHCTACHQRGEFGGATPDRLRFFTTRDEALGQDGRLPPTLTGVGAKLQRAWLVDAIAHGQTVRPYLRTRMPGFGTHVAARLGELLARVDTLPPVVVGALPDDDKQARAVTDLGRELVGDQGMACITCHAFAGEHIGVMAAVDLVDSTGQRLRPEWFRHFLQAPAKFRPGTLMPQFFVDGVSARPQLGGGDVARQLDAIWHYLAEGRNVRKPSGMRQPPIELQVGDEAVLLRRSVQNTGKRGISVGLPLGVNFTFDAESLALNQIWWGKFVDASPVWTGQGSGEARILGQARVTLPSGPALVVLADDTAPWPTASRRELGQQFLGYDLDARQRPAFRYVCDGVKVTDAAVEVATRGEGGKPAWPLLRRRLSFASAADKTLQLRAALDARIVDLGDGVILVGKSLRLHLVPASVRIRPAGEQHELLVAIPIHDGGAEQVIEYQWQEESK